MNVKIKREEEKEKKKKFQSAPFTFCQSSKSRGCWSGSLSARKRDYTAAPVYYCSLQQWPREK